MEIPTNIPTVEATPAAMTAAEFVGNGTSESLMSSAESVWSGMGETMGRNPQIGATALILANTLFVGYVIYKMIQGKNPIPFMDSKKS